jgi:predicted transcriptional regulator
MNFTQYLTEAKKEGANLHLEHIEDEILNRGVNGARDAINFLQSLRDMLAGHSQSKVNVTTKWDGSPAIFCGINPDNGKFFVGTKGVFNANAKLNYTDDDIDTNHPGEGLNAKLKVALRYLPKLGIKGVLQGDMMFAKGDLSDKNIDGEDYITFQPNTIIYAVPADSKLAKTMQAAQMGVVFHTSYTGKTFSDMKASFNIDIKNLSTTKDVWFRDAYFTDASGTASFTEEETKKITTILSTVGSTFKQISSLSLGRISSSDTVREYIKTFNNTKVREGQKITNTTGHTRELIKWIEDKLNKDILAAKMERTKRDRTTIKNEIMRTLRGSAADLTKIFDMQNGMVDAKNMIIKKLQQLRQVTSTFVQTEDGFKVTNPEGFVAVDRLKGNAVKLVDRLEFSHLNFTAQKNWSK